MLDPIVDLAPGAEENDLATAFADVLRHNLRTNARAQKSFGAMRATVHFVAVDTTTLRPESSAGTRYASVLPVPVPASQRSTPPASSVRSTACAIWTWPGRSS